MFVMLLTYKGRTIAEALGWADAMKPTHVHRLMRIIQETLEISAGSKVLPASCDVVQECV